MCEIGNFSIHLTLSNLKTDGKVFIFILFISVSILCVKARELRYIHIYTHIYAYIYVYIVVLHFSGTRSRRFPIPTKNPFTWLFVFVSCPNYTYEVMESIIVIHDGGHVYIQCMFCNYRSLYIGCLLYRLELGWAFPSWPSVCQVSFA